MTTAAVIVAAGAGLRLGADLPKAFVPVADRPMVEHSVAAFQASSADHIVVVVPEGFTDQARRLLGAGVAIVTGGAERQESVSAGLDTCPADTQVVAVHDAARPLVTAALIDRTLAALTPGWDAVAPGVPVVDTLKLVDSRHLVLRTVDRSGLWGVQTPQVATRATLERVHARVAPAADAATDDLSLVERAGGRVRLVSGDRSNFKVTGAEDLALAEMLLAAR